MELLVVLSLIVLLGLAAAIAGVDSRDGADWRQSRRVDLATSGWRART
ncbi:MAG TPA: hypothetical protein VJQ57_14535 [Acidimicrobiia bacterium]|jgi:hypothetical protein|nr:hypothetical protein [Acidimicrobiia bacterium]